MYSLNLNQYERNALAKLLRALRKIFRNVLRTSNQSGFTLIEIMIVMVIISLLAIFSVSMFSQTQKQKAQGLIVVLKQIKDQRAICEIMGQECSQFHHVVQWVDTEGKTHRDDRGLEMDDPSNSEFKYGFSGPLVSVVTRDKPDNYLVLSDGVCQAFGIYKNSIC